jgi:hypothetical protein
VSKKKIAFKAAVFAAPFVWRWWQRRRRQSDGTAQPDASI